MPRLPRRNIRTITRPPRPPRQCSHCGILDCRPFGFIPSCMAGSISKLNTILNILECLAPGISALFFQSCSFEDWEQHLLVEFGTASEAGSLTLTDANYHAFTSHMTSITLCIKHLEKSQLLRRRISSRLARHQPLNIELFKLLNNLRLLSETLQSIGSRIQDRFWQMLELDAEASADQLGRQIMFNLGSKNRSELMVKKVSWGNFSSLGVSRWMADELVNHFVEKWCYQSTVLGLSSLFPAKFLFESEDCITAVDLDNIVSDTEYSQNVLKWIRRCQKTQNVDRFDQLFIPINKGRRHWFSACIDYMRKRIDIYDSIEEVTIANRSKPANERQNAKLMLALMWIADTSSPLRGESNRDIIAKPGVWKFDPHAIVPFQQNTHDCGIHTLWHLKHLIEFGRILEEDEHSGPLGFTDDMVGKRLRLVHELIAESASP